MNSHLSIPSTPIPIDGLDYDSSEFNQSGAISDNEPGAIPENHLDKLRNEGSSDTKLKRMVSLMNKDEYEQNKKRIDEIWKKYDTDRSGVLEKGEAFIFLKDLFRDLFGTESTNEDLQDTF